MIGEAARIRELRDLLWAGGLSDPVVAVEQVAYVALAKQWLQPHVWGELLSEPTEAMYAEFRDTWFSRLPLVAPPPLDAMLHDAVFAIPNVELFREVVRRVAVLPFATPEAGPTFEALLTEFLRERSGVLRTPATLAELMLELTDVRPGDTVCDPVCGTGTLLLAAQRRQGPHAANATGYDVNPAMTRIAALNFFFHAVMARELATRNTLGEMEDGRFDVVLANPPFGGSANANVVDPALSLASKRSELLFLDRCRRLLAPGGRCAIVLPQGALFGRSRGHLAVRRRLLEQTRVRSVVSLGAGWLPGTTVETAVVVFEHPGRVTRRVVFHEAGNDLLAVPPALADGGRRSAGMPSGVAATSGGLVWWASAEEIAAADFNLAPRRHRPLTSDEQAGENPVALLAELRRLQRSYGERIERLTDLLSQ